MTLSWSHLVRRIARGLVFAMLLAALAPAVSRTLASWRAPGLGGWEAVCTASGMRWVQSGGASSESPMQPGHGALDACALCALAAERFAPLIPTPWSAPVLVGEQARPQALCWTTAAWLTCQPSARGPPALS